MTQHRMRAIVVEDEQEARLNLRSYLAGVDWIELAAEARDGGEAVEIIERLRPELLFLDVQLPVRSGIEVLQKLSYTPEVVFTTAFDEHALAAFELGALDYLLKPFGRERFLGAVERVRQRRTSPVVVPSALERMREALETAPLERLFVRSGARIVPLAVADVLRIDAAGDYAEVHTKGGKHLLRISLRELAERLDPSRFLRVHRSHVVNLDAVDHLSAFDERRLVVVLRDGSQVVASRAASEMLRGLAK